MQFLVIARGKAEASPDKIQALGQAEAQMVWQHYTAGRVRVPYYLSDRKGAVLILEVHSYDEAIAIANSFPMAKAELVEMEVIELAPYTGLERLFNT